MTRTTFSIEITGTIKDACQKALAIMRLAVTQGIPAKYITYNASPKLISLSVNHHASIEDVRGKIKSFQDELATYIF